jgi:hypothetical protein
MSRFRGGPHFARPENALKRADELENVGQKLSALQQLHDVVTNKKHRTWSKTYEEIMFKLLDLCVEMKKRNQAKEALMQYRNMCQQVRRRGCGSSGSGFARRRRRQRSRLGVVGAQLPSGTNTHLLASAAASSSG